MVGMAAQWMREGSTGVRIATSQRNEEDSCLHSFPNTLTWLNWNAGVDDLWPNPAYSELTQHFNWSVPSTLHLWSELQ